MASEDQNCPRCGKERSSCTCPRPNRDDGPTGAGPFVPKKREFPKVVAGKDECGICGMPLKDSECPMCGWSPSEQGGRADLRCGFCGSRLNTDGRCTGCGIGLEDLEKGDNGRPKAPVDFSCPVCLKSISLTDYSCPNCGARIWLDVDGELKNLETLRCPKCDRPVSEDDRICPDCMFDIWMGGEDAMRDTVSAALKDAQFQIETGKREGANLDKLAPLLTDMEMKFVEGHYRKAEAVAVLVSNAAKTSVLQYKMFKDALRKAQRLCNDAKEFTDVSELAPILDSAHSEAAKGDYKNAMRFAMKASIMAERLRGKRILGVLER